MTNSYHCYQPVGSMAVIREARSLGGASVGTPVLVVLTDHDDPHLHYGVINALNPPNLPFIRTVGLKRTVLPGHERSDYFYVSCTDLDFCDSVTNGVLFGW